MADVKWIKITTDIFDDEKILLIESLPEADSIIVIWFKLLCMAGKMNNSGVFMLNNRMAYTDSMLATIFRRKETTVKMALDTFEKFGMIERVEDVITIPNWGKHQTLDKIEQKNEYMRNYMKDYRAKQKALAIEENANNPTCKTNVNDLRKSNVSEAEVEEERELEEEREKDNRVDYQRIAAMYNDTCVSFPKLKALSAARKKAIKARLHTYNINDFLHLFQKAEASDFLKGKNNRDWQASFDWLIKDANMAKVLDGNYDSKGQATSVSSVSQQQVAAYVKKEQDIKVVDDIDYSGLL